MHLFFSFGLCLQLDRCKTESRSLISLSVQYKCTKSVHTPLDIFHTFCHITTTSCNVLHMTDKYKEAEKKKKKNYAHMVI